MHLAAVETASVSAFAPAPMTAPSAPRATPAQIMDWLGVVPDPEIPVLSVVDLGMVRAVRWDEDTCVVVITPTYSGCPAMREITQGIEDALQARGLTRWRIETQLAPAWTTDWITAKGRQALQRYGIAAPTRCARDMQAIDIAALRQSAADAVACPHCGSSHTRMVSQFGSTACKALYRCMDCREPFDYFKPH